MDLPYSKHDDLVGELLDFYSKVIEKVAHIKDCQASFLFERNFLLFISIGC